MSAELIQLYITGGAGAVSFFIVVWLVIFLITKLYPLMNVMNKSLDNNTKAMESVVAMDNKLTEIKTSMDRHEIKTDLTHEIGIRVEQSLKSLHKRFDDTSSSKPRNIVKKKW